MGSALESFRDATKAVHSDVEHTATMARMMSAPADRTAYADYLKAIALAIGPLSLDASKVCLADAAPFRPNPEDWMALEDDLCELGVALPSTFAPPPIVRPEDEIWGRLYVVHGAGAGLAMLDALIKKQPSGAALPKRFLATARERRPQWPALCQAIDQLEGERLRLATLAAQKDFAYALDAILAFEASGTGQGA